MPLRQICQPDIEGTYVLDSLGGKNYRFCVLPMGIPTFGRYEVSRKRVLFSVESNMGNTHYL